MLKKTICPLGNRNMKKPVITIGNNVYIRCDRKHAETLYKHNIPLIKIELPETYYISPYGLKYQVIRRDPGKTFIEKCIECYIDNPAFYVPMKTLKSQDGEIMDYEINYNFMDI